MKCFHHNDNDGRCAASLISIIENNTNQDDFIELNYPEIFPTDLISEDEKVYIVDMSFTENTLDQIKSVMDKTKNLIWIDHHKSSVDLIEKHPELGEIEGIVKDGTCGALLTYLYTHDKLEAFNNEEDIEVPDYLLYVDDHDCWKKGIEDSKFFFLGTQATDTTALAPIWTELYNDELGVEEFVQIGKYIWAYLEQTYTTLREEAGYEIEVDGVKAFAINATGNSWVFGDLIKEYPFVIMWNYEDGKYCYSFYSDKDSDFDCSKFAEKLGGGGHRNASGCSSKELLFKKSE